MASPLNALVNAKCPLGTLEGHFVLYWRNEYQPKGGDALP